MRDLLTTWSKCINPISKCSKCEDTSLRRRKKSRKKCKARIGKARIRGDKRPKRKLRLSVRKRKPRLS
jgi:hypothetical protein